MADEKSEQQPAEQRTYKITYADNKTLEAQAESVAWTENGEFILLMDGDVTKHVIVAGNVIAVTQQ